MKIRNPKLINEYNKALDYLIENNIDIYKRKNVYCSTIVNQIFSCINQKEIDFHVNLNLNNKTALIK